MSELSKLKENLFQLLKEATECISPSGHEEDIREFVKEFFKNVADSVHVDALGNVIAVKKGSEDSGKIMLAAHMDEIGLFVSFIEEKGFIRAIPIGGIFERVLVFQRVSIKTRDGKIFKGVIGLKPPHVAKPEEARQIPELKELFIDIGASSRAEVEQLGIKLGDIIVFDRELVKLSNDRVTGKSIDDRVGLITMLKAFELIENNEVSVCAVATVQEEVGLKGAKTAAFSISPDVAIALDVTIANDIPSIPEHEWGTVLGKGPAIKLVDGRNATGLIANREVFDRLISIAQELKLPHQIEISAGGTTDASVIQLNKEGIPTGGISIPSRYIHSPVEVVDLNDVTNAVLLTKRFCEKCNLEWLSKLKVNKIK